MARATPNNASRRPEPDAKGRGYALADLPGRANVLIGAPEIFGGRIGPHARAEKWRWYGDANRQPECWLDVRACGVEPDVAAERIRTVNRNVHGAWQDVDALEIECVRGQGGNGKQRGEIHRMFGASLEWEIEWASKNDLPADRVEIDGETFVPVVFDLDFPAGLSFHYQPALAQEDIDSGAERPENVVGSYAVYWRESGRYLRTVEGELVERVNYQTGKFCHLYRAQLIDADGATCWCLMGIHQSDTGAAELTVYMPLDWLMAASYAVRLDPEFGYSGTPGTRGSAWAAGYAGAFGPWAPGSSGTIDSISAYMDTGAYARSVTMGLYNDGSPYAGTRIVDGGGIYVTRASGSAGWETDTMDTSPAITSGVDLWFCLACSWSWYPYYDTTSGYNGRWKAYTYSHGVTPTTMGSDAGGTSNRYGFYGTYTEAATGNTVVVVPNIEHYYRRRRAG